MHRKPHSLTGDLEREDKKISEHPTAKRDEVAKWISGRLKGRRVNTLLFFTHVVQNTIPRISTSGMFYGRNISTHVVNRLID
jgi:hypothetical protein